MRRTHGRPSSSRRHSSRSAWPAAPTRPPSTGRRSETSSGSVLFGGPGPSNAVVTAFDFNNPPPPTGTGSSPINADTVGARGLHRRGGRDPGGRVLAVRAPRRGLPSSPAIMDVDGRLQPVREHPHRRDLRGLARPAHHRPRQRDPRSGPRRGRGVGRGRDRGVRPRAHPRAAGVRARDADLRVHRQDRARSGAAVHPAADRGGATGLLAGSAAQPRAGLRPRPGVHPGAPNCGCSGPSDRGVRHRAVRADDRRRPRRASSTPTRPRPRRAPACSTSGRGCSSSTSARSRDLHVDGVDEAGAVAGPGVPDGRRDLRRRGVRPAIAPGEAAGDLRTDRPAVPGERAVGDLHPAVPPRPRARYGRGEQRRPFNLVEVAAGRATAACRPGPGDHGDLRSPARPGRSRTRSRRSGCRTTDPGVDMTGQGIPLEIAP